jgi:acylpyruvate hydrolase
MDKIICVGKNYTGHAKELGEIQPSAPLLFLKPACVLKRAANWGDTVLAKFPVDAEVVPECELVIEIGKNGQNISLQDAHHFIQRISVGLDVTLRAKQRKLKQQGHPWTTAKVFPDAAILGPWIEVAQLPSWPTLPFGLSYNGTLVQTGKACEMIHSPAFLIHFISHCFPLCVGDVIYTGTPVGCYVLDKGQQLDVILGEHQYSVQWT